ncbi:MAG: hypothetical protein DRR08_00335 [Candidatus Parabeggiatoa sp. nov. 2]|nr:MAG: hypothetical protein DRR08_00335 [Gammaproteobacteria bacterium]
MPQGIVYGGGIGQFWKPSFFIGRLYQQKWREGLEILMAADEYARDLSAPPAMTLGFWKRYPGAPGALPLALIIQYAPFLLIEKPQWGDINIASVSTWREEGKLIKPLFSDNYNIKTNPIASRARWVRWQCH